MNFPLPKAQVQQQYEGDLGPNQIKWLRANIRPFDLAWRQVKAADANAAKVAKELGIDESAEIPQ